MLRSVRRWWLALGALVASAAILLPALVLAPVPSVTGQATPEAQALRHLRQLLRAHDPRRSRPGRLVVLSVTPSELDLLVGYGGQWLGGRADATLAPGRLDLRLSLPAPLGPFGGWLNLGLSLGDQGGVPHVERLTVGRLALPSGLTLPLLKLLLSRWDDGGAATPPLSDMLKGIRLQPDRAQFVYEWRADAAQRVLARLLPPALETRLHAYHDRLAEVAGAGRGPLDLPALMMPMFALAQQRSAGGDATAENRAALLTLALYVTGRPLPSLLPTARAWQRLRWRPVLLAERYDFPQHLLASAALAAQAGGPLADALGLAKEVSDARDGSGFSFNDLAVNRAGTRLGEVAVRDAQALQARLAAGVRASELIPDVSDLPEFLPEATFLARYGGVGAPAYQRLVGEIEARIAALPMYR